MRIAVVDDESMFCMQMEMMVEKIANAKKLPFTIESFEDGETFIKALSSTRYDIVFMDIFMPGMDGIETATKLRELTERTFLIFMTASEGHYPDAFALHAFDYVTKPFTMGRIEQVLDEIVDHTPLDEAFVKISVGARDIRIYLRDITAITTDGHYLDIHTESGEDYRARMTANDFLEAAGQDARFITANRGVIVNMDAIDKVDGLDIVMDDGEIYSMPGKKSAALAQQIQDYQFSHK